MRFLLDIKDNISTELSFDVYGSYDMEEIDRIILYEATKMLFKEDILLNRRTRGFDCWTLSRRFDSERELSVCIKKFMEKFKLINRSLMEKLENKDARITLQCVVYYDQETRPIIHLDRDILNWINSIGAELVIELSLQ